MTKVGTKVPNPKRLNNQRAILTQNGDHLFCVKIRKVEKHNQTYQNKNTVWSTKMLIDHFSFPTWTQKPKLSTKTTARLEILQQTAENIRSESFPICIVVRKIIISGRKKTPQVIQSDLLIQSDHISQKKDTLNHLAFIFSFFLLGSKRFNHQKIFGGKKKLRTLTPVQETPQPSSTRWAWRLSSYHQRPKRSDAFRARGKGTGQHGLGALQMSPWKLVYKWINFTYLVMKTENDGFQVRNLLFQRADFQVSS